jgi:hypothetical protein
LPPPPIGKVAMLIGSWNVSMPPPAKTGSAGEPAEPRDRRARRLALLRFLPRGNIVQAVDRVRHSGKEILVLGAVRADLGRDQFSCVGRSVIATKGSCRPAGEQVGPHQHRLVRLAVVEERRRVLRLPRPSASTIGA